MKDFLPLRENHKTRRGGNCTWKICRPSARIKYPAGVEWHLEDFSPLRENHKPRRGGMALGRFFALARESQTPPGWKIFGPCARITNPARVEEFSPLGENHKPRRGGIALGGLFALARESNSPPGWNCTLKIFRPCARIKYPVGVELHLEDFFPLGENHKPRVLQTPPGWNCTRKILRPCA